MNAAVRLANVSCCPADVSFRLDYVSLHLPDVSLLLPDVSLRLPDISLRLANVSLRLPDMSVPGRHVPPTGRCVPPPSHSPTACMMTSASTIARRRGCAGERGPLHWAVGFVLCSRHIDHIFTIRSFSAWELILSFELKGVGVGWNG